MQFVFGATVLTVALASIVDAQGVEHFCNRRLDDIDFPGSDIGSRPSSQALDCFHLCEYTAGCNSFTWTNYNGGTCWFKSSFGYATTKLGAVSGISDYKIDDNRHCVGIQVQLVNCDMPGNDIDNLKSHSYYECADQCSRKSSCKAATWTDYNGGTCWRKSKVSQCVYGQNAFTAVVPKLVCDRSFC